MLESKPSHAVPGCRLAKRSQALEHILVDPPRAVLVGAGQSRTWQGLVDIEVRQLFHSLAANPLVISHKERAPPKWQNCIGTNRLHPFRMIIPLQCSFHSD